MEEPLAYTMHGMTPDMRKVARKTLGETEQVKHKAIEELRRLAKGETNLFIPQTDEYFVQFLRARKYDTKKAFKLIKSFWGFKQKYMHIFEILDLDKIKEVMEHSCIGVLPQRDREGCTVLVIKFSNYNPKLTTFEDLFLTSVALLNHGLKYPASQIHGYRIIMDFRHLSWAQMKVGTPANLYLLVHSVQYTFPGRYKGIHVLFESRIFKAFWSLAVPLLSPKVKTRVHMLGTDVSTIKDYIHPSVLPSEFGGDAGPFNNSKILPLFESEAKEVLDLMNYGYMDTLIIDN